MKINADLSRRVVLATGELPWVASPLVGVERRMLDRDGDEVARATSLVRYAPGSHFSAHIHGGGEEFLVLEGTFSDEHGDYPAGMYVRNPPGSQHTPRSDAGCTILVKLWQMDPDDEAFVRLDTTDRSAFQPTDVAGETALELYTHGDERVRMLGWEPGAALGERTYPGGAELFVVEGAFEDEGGAYRSGAWLRLPPGSCHTPVATDSSRVLIKTGHLADPPGGPAT
jgi:anti-sigma factor ChrR (cupin superfamily)